MPITYPPKLIEPRSVYGSGEVGNFPFDLYTCAYLAQGDSWFSFGAVPPSATSNVLDELDLARSTVIVNCAVPGKVLRRMTDTTREKLFLGLLTGRLALKWNAILLSGMGNDLIDAAGASPTAPPHLRLLRSVAERGAGPHRPPLSGDDYISNPGWATFASHLGVVLQALLQRRDSGINQRVPLLLHNYSRLMPRPAPAGLGFGPWLAPSLTRFAVPAADWLAVTDALMDRLDTLVRNLIQAHRQADPTCALYLVDTRSAGLLLAKPGSAGESGDFINEIHPSRSGYRKVAALWSKQMDSLP